MVIILSHLRILSDKVLLIGRSEILKLRILSHLVNILAMLLIHHVHIHHLLLLLHLQLLLLILNTLSLLRILLEIVRSGARGLDETLRLRGEAARLSILILKSGYLLSLFLLQVPVASQLLLLFELFTVVLILTMVEAIIVLLIMVH